MNYKTVKQLGYAELVEKKSRFISRCVPVKTEEEALAFINEVRAKHRDATHNVYAYIIRENNIMRYSDDGEPSGTAGLPTLEALRCDDLTDAAIVVTRYFGGTLLGTGGLTRTYGRSARLGVDAAIRIEKQLCRVYRVRVDYSAYGRIQYAALELGCILKNTEFTDAVELTFCVRLETCGTFEKAVTEESAGRYAAEPLGEEYVDAEVGEAVCNSELR